MKIEGSVVPVPSEKVLSKLRRYRQKSFQRSDSKNHLNHEDMIKTDFRNKKRKDSTNMMLQTSHMRNLTQVFEKVTKKVDKINENTNFDESEDTDAEKITDAKKKTVKDLKDRMRIESMIFNNDKTKGYYDIKSKTKGKYPINIQTEGDRWRKDKQWQAKANPIARDAENKWNQNDLKLLEKRRNQRVLKNLAMESSWRNKQ